MNAAAHRPDLIQTNLDNGMVGAGGSLRTGPRGRRSAARKTSGNLLVRPGEASAVTPSGCPVLFVMAPGGTTRRFPEHLGTAFLRTVLLRAGIDSRQYMPEGSPGLSEFADTLRELRPRLVGFTVYETNLRVSRAMVETVREAIPGCVVAVGGPNATFTPDETLELLGADVCLRGAGEGTIVSLVEQILGSDSGSRTPDRLRDVPNLVLRMDDGATHHTRPEDLSSFPARYFATLDDIPSPFQSGVVATADIGYLTARGCNQHCTYCSFAALSGRRVAFHSVERVLDDLAALEALSVRVPHRHRDVSIFDDAFSLAPERARRICEGLLERGIRLRLRCQTRGDRVTPELLRLMRRVGFIGVGFGLESAVPRVLRAIGKVCAPDSVDDPQFERERQYLESFRRSVESAKRCGLSVDVSVMIGLPADTVDGFRTTLEFVSALGVDNYAHNVLNVAPGTPMYEGRRVLGLEAFRDPRTAIWRTIHAFDVDKVRPLANSHLHGVKWSGAQALSDALCGRSGSGDRAESVASVVIHGHRRSSRLGEWLRRVLAINGLVVAFEDSRAEAEEWRGFLTEYRVPFGDVCGLFPAASGRPASFDVLSGTGEHQVRLVSSCSVDLARAPVEVDEAGNCAISIWLASAPDARTELPAGWECPLVGPGLQVADSCRIGTDSPRCRHPRVLHVDSEGNLRACWQGPILGAVGDRPTAIGSRSATNHARRDVEAAEELRTVCPLGVPAGMTEDVRSTLWDLDLASQLTWPVIGVVRPRANAAPALEVERSNP
jgi:radical SAM superfamily enzyme YgiQ (UPF0313 family)